MSATTRLMKELKSLQSDPPDDIVLYPLDDADVHRWVAFLTGPPDTPYEGGHFVLDIKIPETYPFNPPKVRFLTRIWHPNISSVTGAICLDILKDQWAAAMTLRTVLLSLQALMAAAEPDDPQDAVVARQYKERPDMFRNTATHWTNKYASGQSAPNRSGAPLGAGRTP